MTKRLEAQQRPDDWTYISMDRGRSQEAAWTEDEVKKLKGAYKYTVARSATKLPRWFRVEGKVSSGTYGMMS
jgi:hypothetical protein